MNKKIYISPSAQTWNKYTGYPHISEHDYCNELGELLQFELRTYGATSFVAPLKKTLAERCKEANANGYNMYVCLHTNAASKDGQAQTYASGAEMCYYGKQGGRSYFANYYIYHELVKLYPSIRGMKSGTNFYENNNTVMVSCYPEIAFHDNPNDLKFLLNNKQAIAKAIATGIYLFLR